MSKTTKPKPETVYDFCPPVLSALCRRDELRARLAQLTADELAAVNEPPRGNAIADEAARLLRGEPTPAPQPNIGHERRVVEEALRMAERALGAEILNASRLELERVKPEHAELLADIDHAVDAMLSAVQNEIAFRNDLQSRGFSATGLLEPFGGHFGAFGQALRRFDYEAWRGRLARHGAEL